VILVKHKDYEEYVRTQQSLTATKVNAVWGSEKELLDVNELIHRYVSNIETMVCHGCRNGFEADFFQKLNPNAKVFGTDLYDQAYRYDRTYFRNIDFDIVPGEWVKYFDVIYSNSIDHSRNPINTLLAWKSELKRDGICLVTFHWGTKGDKGDCFHLSLDAAQLLDNIPKYELEIKDIAKEAGMKLLGISKPKTLGFFYVNSVLGAQ
jgi:hypothetical protein